MPGQDAGAEIAHQAAGMAMPAGGSLNGRGTGGGPFGGVLGPIGPENATTATGATPLPASLRAQLPGPIQAGQARPGWGAAAEIPYRATDIAEAAAGSANGRVSDGDPFDAATLGPTKTDNRQGFLTPGAGVEPVALAMLEELAPELADTLAMLLNDEADLRGIDR
jgi:hypothetical protein